MTDIVNTKSGPVRGTTAQDDESVRVFKGIPYAKAADGARRWRPPEPMEPWDDVLDATEYGLDCPQDPFMPRSRAPGMGEDCLNLNIWSPAKDAGEKLPVLVWLYGGSYVRGSAADTRAEGEGFAKKGVVYVTFNYRAGLFGFFAHPELTRESPNNSSGNYGLLDAFAAMKWIKENIEAFGGDRDRVTVFGVSAGSATISLLITSPLGAGLWDQAILQSPGAFRPLYNLADAEQEGLKLGDDLDAMRKMTPEEIVARTPDFQPKVRGLTTPRVLRPIRDGWVIPLEEQDAYSTGAINVMPVIVGNMEDEGSWGVAGWPIETMEDYREIMETNFADQTDEAIALYPATTEAEMKPRLGELFGDTQFTYGSWRVAAEMAAREPKTFRYVFTRRAPGMDGAPGHGDDVEYVFGNVKDAGDGYDDTDFAISDVMMDAFLRFARTGNPNGGEGLPDWPAYTEANDPYMEFGDEISLKNNWRAPQMKFLHRYLNNKR
ncbi:MAG: carboxylesterase family protein [Rhodospirillales bacterium]|nr:carboxylesterase family protein [Rhodospirillales bacterium]